MPLVRYVTLLAYFDAIRISEDFSGKLSFIN